MPCGKPATISKRIARVPRKWTIQGQLGTQWRGIQTYDMSRLDDAKGQRERVVILGSGWAGLHPHTLLKRQRLQMNTGYLLSRTLSPKKFQILLISPRSHFCFTPLLNSTAVGTLELRCALEPIRCRKGHIEHMQCWAEDIDFRKKILTVEDSVLHRGQAHSLTRGLRGKEEYVQGEEENAIAKYDNGQRFDVSYDKLVIGVGCYNQTFGIEGVRQHAFFLKDVGDARRVRKRILECFEIASLPTTTDAFRKQLLTFAIVGGGPTGMEFAAELSDLISQDMTKIYPSFASLVRIIVFDTMPTVLSGFDAQLSGYAMAHFKREKVDIRTSRKVRSLRRGVPDGNGNGGTHQGTAHQHGCCTLTTDQDGDVGVGMCVWSTGIMMNPFVEHLTDQVYTIPGGSAELSINHPMTSLPQRDDDSVTTTWRIEKNPKTGALVVDKHLRLQLQNAAPRPRITHPDAHCPHLPPSTSATHVDPQAAHLSSVFALGDNASIRSLPLPTTAQTASQQALWLGRRLNAGDVATQEFHFRNMGIMAYLGRSKALLQTGKGGKWGGHTAWLVWRGGYWGMQRSWRNRMCIPMYWCVFSLSLSFSHTHIDWGEKENRLLTGGACSRFLNWAFGRDITRF